MENENSIPNEELDADYAMTAEDEAAFESEWDEPAEEADDFELEAEEAEGEPDAQPDEPEDAGTDADAEQGDSVESEGEEEPAADEEKKPEAEKETKDQRFKLKHNGEESEVDYDKVIELAQKGMDYDRVREERDKFRVEAPTMQKYREQDAFLTQLAEDSGLSVEELIENTRARMLMNKDPDLSEEEALEKVRGGKKEKAEEPSEDGRRQTMFANFIQAYPEVKPDEIPAEVWADAARTFDLTGAYQRYENKKLKEEVAKLRQNNKNKDRSTGSRRSVGAHTPKDAFDEGWDSFD